MCRLRQLLCAVPSLPSLSLLNVSITPAAVCCAIIIIAFFAYLFQFLDCAYQLLCQFPTEFEFNPLFLADLAELVYSGRFSTFLYDTDR
jgi:hypothetical protein